MWPVALSGRLPVEALVGHYPTNKLIGRDPIPYRRSFPTTPCSMMEHRALPPVSRSYSRVQGRSVTHYSPVRHSHPIASYQDPVRLACVKHAASARPEPESNSPQKNHEKPEKIPAQKRRTTTPTPQTGSRSWNAQTKKKKHNHQKRWKHQSLTGIQKDY